MKTILDFKRFVQRWGGEPIGRIAVLRLIDAYLSLEPLQDNVTVRCFAVVYSNYEPLELDSLWSTREKAKARAEELNGDYRVVEIGIH